MKKIIMVSLVLVFALSITIPVFAHCEIPCGIYHDRMRIHLIEEHIQTIEKSMKEIIRLSKEKEINYNQLVRWINNKEVHANYIQEIVMQYFMTQRIKPMADKDSDNYRKYIHELILLHELLVYSMKAKQTTDLKNVGKLRSLLKDFEKSYFKK